MFSKSMRKEVNHLKKLKQIVLVTALFVVATVSVSANASLASAATVTPMHSTHPATPTPTKPGWGTGSDNGAQAGPGGVSVRSNDNVSITNTFNVLAQGSAKVVINVTNVVYHTIFGK
jgi:hypothetical protein